MFKKVLVAVDFSGPAMELLNAVTDLQHMGLEELVIVHVIRMESAAIGLSAKRRDFLKKIDKRKHELEEQGLSVRVLQPVGNPAEEIKTLAAEENADLILIGSLGEGSLVRKLFLGSTVTDVIRGTRKPVLIEKYYRDNGLPVRMPVFKDSEPTTALLATDFSRSSIHIFDTFLENPGVFNKVILYHVVDEGYTEEQIKKNSEKALAKLEGWKNEFTERGFEVEIEVAVGVASELIIEASKKKHISMLAITRRGRSMVDELVIGSTADQIVRHSVCPVLLLKN
ncbi:MAG: universal stress protein [Firmicutes bacterium]|nr:universal stress protein [Bacillota bacterium]